VPSHDRLKGGLSKDFVFDRNGRPEMDRLMDRWMNETQDKLNRIESQEATRETIGTRISHVEITAAVDTAGFFKLDDRFPVSPDKVTIDRFSVVPGPMANSRLVVGAQVPDYQIVGNKVIFNTNGSPSVTLSNAIVSGDCIRVV